MCALGHDPTELDRVDLDLLATVSGSEPSAGRTVEVARDSRNDACAAAEPTRWAASARASIARSRSTDRGNVVALGRRCPTQSFRFPG
jgi:hypothetical protein